MKKTIYLFAVLLFATACSETKKEEANTAVFIQPATVENTIDEVVKKHGDTAKTRIEKGVTQAAALWTKEDGSGEDFTKFCVENFIADEAALQSAFEKISTGYEVLSGNFNKMGLDLRLPLDLDKGEVTPIDMIFGSYSPSAHLTDDFFANKMAFIIVLNFPAYTLKEKMAEGANWNRQQWAYARLGDFYTSRVPAQLNLDAAAMSTKADSYISEYNICMGYLVNDNNETLFAKDMKLITHWGLRDELKSNYIGEKGLEKQRMVYDVMKHIIAQTIPQEVINSEKYTWNPKTNKVYAEGKEVQFTAEPNTRYEMFLGNFKAMKAMDAYNPQYPTFIQRAFDQGLEIPMEEVEKLFVDVVSSPQIREAGKLIAKRLGRNLEPFDIWYDGFKARSTMNQEVLDKTTKTKYPTREAFEKDLPNILTKLSFSKERADYLCSKITVDASRGAGHAAGAYMRGDKARLRTRIGADGMNYKGYNIAVHEFGHNVEQTISLYDVDYYTMAGVPNTGFTEALAFIFQKRDLDLLGIKDPNPNKEYMLTLDNFWSAYEIMGVSLLDMATWQWLYENPNATPEELKVFVISKAKEIWNKYYADVFGSKDEPILAIYSHMINYPLYLPAYPIGQLIQFQVEEQMKGKNFAAEVDRIYKQGRLVPQLWMQGAVGKELSAEPILNAATEAMKHM